MKPHIGITTGDPAGVGPEISVRAAYNPELIGTCGMVLFGDIAILRTQAAALGLPFDFEQISREDLLGSDLLPARAVVDVPARRSEISPGKGSAASGEAAAHNIEECAGACMKGRLDAIVTAPLNKKHLREAGYDFPGHTEFLANLAKAHDVAMAFLTERLKVVLVTIHVPLRIAIEQITPSVVLGKIEITLREFRRLGLPCDSVAVAGMNPHAGEGGLLGREEAERIEPAIVEARRRHPESRIVGPLPADTIFYRAVQGEFDVVLALFHDQGLGPIKLLGFGEAVNVTLGLPFVRTSVDHGTAYDIAGKGIARPESMLAAVRWAVRLARPR